MNAHDIEGMSIEEAINLLIVLGGTLAEAADNGRYGAGATRAEDGKTVFIVAVVGDDKTECFQKLEDAIFQMRNLRGADK